jgi:S1-C subfamily serine protease
MPGESIVCPKCDAVTKCAHFFQALNCKRYATQPASQSLCGLKKTNKATRFARKFLAGILPVALVVAGLSAYSQSRRGRTTPPRLEAKQIAQKTLPSVVLVVIDCENGRTFSQGSGFFVSEGIVATNRHVVECGYKGGVKVIGQDRLYPVGAQWLAPDDSLDLALLRVEDVNQPPLALSGGRNVSVGEKVYAAGNPKGLEGTFSDGIVSSVRTSERLIQHTAPISPGSSGGPLLDEYGKVIGVNTLAFREAQNLNFAVPAIYLNALLEQVKNRKVLARTPPRSPGRPVAVRRASPPRTEGKSPRTEPDDVGAGAKSNPPINAGPPIGSKATTPEKPPFKKSKVYLGTVPDYVESYHGVLVDVRDDSPAAKAGLKDGDRIVKLAGREIKNIYDYSYVLGEMEPDQEYEVEVRRGVELLKMKLTPQARR